MMRLYELTPAAPLKNKQKQKLNNVVYTWDQATNQWLDPRGIKAGGAAHLELMKAVGRNPDGTTFSPGVFAKAKAAFDKAIGGSLGGAIDPKASLLGKAMGRVGAALGRGAAALVRPKAGAQDTNGDGQPDAPTAQPPQTPQAPKMGSGDTRQGAVQVDQDLGKLVQQMRSYKPNPQSKPLPAKFAQSLENDMKNMRTNKDWAVMTGNKIIKYAELGYNVDALQKKWAQEYAVGSKQKIMQDQFSEELETLKKLAGI